MELQGGTKRTESYKGINKDIHCTKKMKFSIKNFFSKCD